MKVSIFTHSPRFPVCPQILRGVAAGTEREFERIVSMEKEINLRRWIKRGLSKDGRTLDFSNRRITLDVAVELGENVAVEGLEIIYLYNTGLKDNALEELCDSEFFPPTLKELWMYDNRLVNEGLEALSENKIFSKLRYLSLYSNRIDARGAEALANSPVFSNLETLDLSFNRIGDEGAAALANSPHLGKLKTLHVDANRIGFDGMKAFSDSSALKSLTSLNITYNMISPEGFEMMAESEFLSALPGVKTDLPVAPDDD